MEEKSSLKLSVFLRRLAGEHREPVLNLMPVEHRQSIHGDEINKRRSWFVRTKAVTPRASMDLSRLRSFSLKPTSQASRRSSAVVEKLHRPNMINFDDLIDKQSSHIDTTIRISLTPELAQDKTFPISLQ